MKSTHPNIEPKERSYHGRKLHLKIKRIRTEPRQRIRQLLRASIPLNQSVNYQEAEAFVHQ